MKRVLVLLLALMFVGLAAFADDMAAAPKISGWMMGSAYLDDSSGNFGWGPGWAHMKNETGGWYSTLNLTYDGKDYGYQAQMEFDQGVLASFENPTSPLYAYLFRSFSGYYKFADGLVKVTAGKILDGEYGVTDFVEGDGITPWFGTSVAEPAAQNGAGNIYVGDMGAMVQIYPMAGLNVGLGLAIPATNFQAYWGPGGAADYSKALSIAAQYAIPDLVTISAFYRGNGEIVQVSASYTGMKNLTAVASFEDSMANGTSGAPTYMAWIVSGGYVMAPFTFGLSYFGSQLTQSGINDNLHADWGIEGMAEYSFGAPWSVGAKVGYENTAWSAPINGWIYGNVNGLVVEPYVKAAFANGASMMVGFQWTSGISRNAADDTTVFGATYNSNVNGSYWSIPVNFVIAF